MMEVKLMVLVYIFKKNERIIKIWILIKLRPFSNKMSFNDKMSFGKKMSLKKKMPFSKNTVTKLVLGLAIFLFIVDIFVDPKSARNLSAGDHDSQKQDDVAPHFKGNIQNVFKSCPVLVRQFSPVKKYFKFS